ncbi:HIT family protein [Streptomyces sp. P38-E01]|uniref:HIT family protein n=1 Tax=Streptomyces tardus TaxID=2780544 RepID=A0A949NBB3_9ACTN|nr:HIT family protein [Streptomyces tardus]MBU7600693.1 HIT family protein [Streptomyces tardus]
MRCVFCAIIAGEGPAHWVLREDETVAFLDSRPLFPGHVLVVPVRHVPTLTDLAPQEIGPYYSTVRRVTEAVERATPAQGSFVASNNRVSQSVPHLHTHVVPRNRGDGLRGFFWPRRGYRDRSEAGETAARLRTALEETAPGRP